MAGRIVLGVGGAILLATAGAAVAADIPPVVVPPIVVAAPVASAPRPAVTLEASVAGPVLAVGGVAAIEVKTLSGWGFSLAATNTAVPQFANIGTVVLARASREAGSVEIGGFGIVGVSRAGPFGFLYFGFGGDFALDTERFDIDHRTVLNLPGGVLDTADTTTVLTFEATERLTVTTTVVGHLAFHVSPPATLSVTNRLTFAPIPQVEVYAQLSASYANSLRVVPLIGLRLPLDWITPSVELRFYPGEIDTTLAVDLDVPIAGGPLHLIGRAEAFIANTTLFSYGGKIGLRYEFGGGVSDAGLGL